MWSPNTASNQALRASALSLISSGQSQYAREMSAREALYNRDWRDFEQWAMEYIGRHYTSPLHKQRLIALWPRTSPLTVVVDTMATAYLTTPSRALTGPSGAEYDPAHPARRAFDAWVADSPLDELGRDADRKSILCNASFTWVQWDAFRSRCHYTVLGPQRIYADPDPNFPGDLQRARWIAVAVENQIGANDVMAAGRLPQRKYHLYTRQPDGTVSHVESGENRVATREYPVLADYPLIRASEAPEADSEFWPTGSDDLLAEPLAWGRRRAEIEYALQYSGLPTLTLAGSRREPGPVPVGPGAVLALGDGETAAFLESGASIAAAQEASERLLTEWLRSRFVPPQAWKIGDGAVESGIARYMAMLPLLEQRQSRLPRWQAWEAEVWRISIVVRAAHVAARDYSPSARPEQVYVGELPRTTLRAVFPAATAALSPLEEAQIRRDEQAEGLRSPADELVRRGAAQNRDEALRIIAENKRSAAPVAATNPLLEGFINGQ